MNILVTGGAGFIGRHLIPILLDSGHTVTVIDSLTRNIHGDAPQLPSFLHDDCRFDVRDICDPRTWRILPELRPEVVVHLAAETGVGQSMYEISRYTEVNIQGTAVMLDALRESGGVGRVVLASSRAVYGEGSYACELCGVVTPDPRPVERLEAGLWSPPCPTCGGELTSIATSESSARKPGSIYAMTKAAQEDLVTIAAPTLGASTAVLRYANVYGEGQPLTNPYTGVLSAFALRLVRGGAPEVYEDGQSTRDFVHVLDVATATRVALESEASLSVNIGSGERWTLREIAEELTRVFGRDPSEVFVSGKFRVGDIRGYLADVAAMRELLGFQATIGLGDGLRGFAQWVREEAEIPDSDVAAEAERHLSDRGLLGRVGNER